MESNENTSKSKNKWNLKDRPIVIVLGIIIATVTITYAVIDKLLIEQYRLENTRLEKLIDQQETINSMNEVIESLRNVMKQQNSLLDSLRRNQNIKIKPPTINKTQNLFFKKKISEAKKLIEEGSKISNMNVGGNDTFDLFSSWRNKCLSFVSSIDKELKSNYEKEFSNLTELTLSNYPEIPSKIEDGIITINTIKHILESK